MTSPSDAVGDARRIAGWLEDRAQATDRARLVPAEHFWELGRAGLNGLFGPVDQGGLDAPPAVAREVLETLAGACGVTYFTWVQHHGVVRALSATQDDEVHRRHLRLLCDGSQLAGVAFAYLRRPGPAAVEATPVDGGLLVTGEAPWVTSWGRAQMLLVSARLPDRAVVSFRIPAVATSTVRPSAPLPLSVMGASGTVRLRFCDLRVGESDVVSVVPADEWARRDRIGTAQPNPAVFGIVGTCVRLLGERGGDDDVRAAAGALGDELRRCREASYELVDAPLDGSVPVDDLVAAKAWSIDLACRASSSLVLAAGGGAMSLEHPAQRLQREAAFYLVQAQTASGRTAGLQRLVERAHDPR